MKTAVVAGGCRQGFSDAGTLAGFIGRQTNRGAMAKVFVDQHPEVADRIGPAPLSRAPESPSDGSEDRELTELQAFVQAWGKPDANLTHAYRLILDRFSRHVQRSLRSEILGVAVPMARALPWMAQPFF